jgi:hypothetical protein
MLAVALTGCRSSGPPPETPSGERGKSPAPPPVATTDTTARQTSTSPRPAPKQPVPGATRRDTVPIPTSGRRRPISVAELVASAAYNSAVVDVQGHCRAFEPGLASGPPPSRSAWILQGEGTAIYVVGNFPPGCTATTSSSGLTTVRARVVEDTVRVLGGGGALKPRRYLVKDR